MCFRPPPRWAARAIGGPIAVTPNTDYVFSAWVYRSESNGNAYVDMGDIRDEVQLVSTGETGVWQQLSGTWNSASHRSVTLRCVTDGGITSAVWFDSISLVAR